MPPRCGPIEVERRIHRLGGRQHGEISRAQLLDLGLGPGAIKHRLGTGRLVRSHPGVYSVGVPAATPERRWIAAVLACGSGAVLSHLSAAALWEIRPLDPVVIDVSIPRRGARTRNGIRVHRPRRLGAEDTTCRRGIPVTSPPRTLVDLAEVLSARSLERAIDEAEFLKLLDWHELAETLHRNFGRTGAKRLRRTLGRHEAGSTRTRTKLEETFYLLVTNSGLPPPEVNVRVGSFTVDFLWRDAGLVVETDGRASHDRAAQREEDSRRDALLAAAGFETLRFTWSQVRGRPGEVLSAVRAKLR